MNATYKLALAMIVGAGLGGAAMQGLHAQAKPPVYYIGENDVRNAEGYAKEYLPLVAASIKAYGGRYVAAGTPVGIHGEPPQERFFFFFGGKKEQLRGFVFSPGNQDPPKGGRAPPKFPNFPFPASPKNSTLLAHAVQLEHGIDRVAGRRRHA